MRNLIFNMYGSSTGTNHVFNGAGNIKRPTPTGVDIDQQRHFNGGGNTAHIFEYVIKASHTQIGQTVGGIRNTTTGEVNGFVANLLSHHRAIRVDGAEDLQRFVIR